MKRLLKEGLIAYGGPVVLLILMALPGLNQLFSGHGGIGWILLALAFPVGVVAGLVRALRPAPEPRLARMRLFAIVSVIYLLVLFPLAKLGSNGLKEGFGLQVGPTEIVRTATLPLSLLWPEGPAP